MTRAPRRYNRTALRRLRERREEDIRVRQFVHRAARVAERMKREQPRWGMGE